MVAGMLSDESNQFSQTVSNQCEDSAEPKVQTRDVPSNEDCSPDDDEEEVDWDEEKENEEGEEDQEDLDEIESDDDGDCCLDACEASASASVEQARLGLRRMQTVAALDGDEEGEPEEREDGEEHIRGLSLQRDKSGVTAEVEGSEGALEAGEDGAGGSEGEDDGEEKAAEAIAEPEPRADGFMGCSAAGQCPSMLAEERCAAAVWGFVAWTLTGVALCGADSSGVTMRREVSWEKPKAGKKSAGERKESKDARAARGERPALDRASSGSSFRLGRTGSSSQRAAEVLVD
eukprot:1723409-Rhodomonas_salina.2